MILQLRPAWSGLLPAVVVICALVVPPSQALTAGQSSILERITHRGILRVGVNPHFVPFSYTLKTSRRSGADKFIQSRVGIDIDTAVLLATGLHVELDIIVPDRFDQLIAMLQSGEIDIAIAALSRVFERALLVDFSAPYYDSEFSILLNLVKGYRIGIGDARSQKALMTALEAVKKEDQLVVAITRAKSAVGFIGDYFRQARILKYDTDRETIDGRFRRIRWEGPDFPPIHQYAMPLCRQEHALMLQEALDDRKISAQDMIDLKSRAKRAKHDDLALEIIARKFIKRSCGTTAG